MTVIVVRKHKDEIILAADSQTTSGDLKYNSAKKIIEINDKFVVGIAGRCKIAFLFEQYCKQQAADLLSDNKATTLMQVAEFSQNFCKWIKDNFKDLGQIKDSNYVEDIASILIINKKVYCLSDSYPEECKTYWAVGCGRDVALGALHTGATAEQAVAAACHYSASCCGPVRKKVIKLLKKKFPR